MMRRNFRGDALLHFEVLSFDGEKKEPLFASCSRITLLARTYQKRRLASTRTARREGEPCLHREPRGIAIGDATHHGVGRTD